MRGITVISKQVLHKNHIRDINILTIVECISYQHTHTTDTGMSAFVSAVRNHKSVIYSGF